MSLTLLLCLHSIALGAAQEQSLRRQETKERLQERKREFLRVNRQLIKEGHKPFYLKKSLLSTDLVYYDHPVPQATSASWPLLTRSRTSNRRAACPSSLNDESLCG